MYRYDDDVKDVYVSVPIYVAEACNPESAICEHDRISWRICASVNVASSIKRGGLKAKTVAIVTFKVRVDNV